MTIGARARALQLSETTLAAVLTKLFGPQAVPWREIPCGGGSISEASILELPRDQRVFLKRNCTASAAFFVSEAMGLFALREVDIAGIRVPQPFAVFTEHRCTCFLMEYIETAAPQQSSSEKFGRALAQLHRARRAPQCGFPKDNLIGATKQVNTWHDDWYAFFGEQRLRIQAQWAWENQRDDGSLYQAVERVVSRLPELLPPLDPGGSSLLHGDLWAGNVLFPGDGTTALIDPAVYYGHREADVAMTGLFGGFSPDFYRAYQEEWPLEPGFDERRDIYNLYHLLNHLNLFGSSYRRSCDAIARRFGS